MNAQEALAVTWVPTARPSVVLARRQGPFSPIPPDRHARSCCRATCCCDSTSWPWRSSCCPRCPSSSTPTDTASGKSSVREERAPLFRAGLSVLVSNCRLVCLCSGAARAAGGLPERLQVRADGPRRGAHGSRRPPAAPLLRQRAVREARERREQRERARPGVARVPAPGRYGPQPDFGLRVRVPRRY